MKKDTSVNVLGGALQPCSVSPMTGFFRDGACNTCWEDHGLHTVCVVLTAEFLAWSRYIGNDLTTPRPDFAFPGLKPGERWCLCAGRFLEAHDEGCAPQVVLECTHKRTLEVVPLEVLSSYAI
ncbi:DUF2237 family protein [Rhodobacter lacus]|uniref:DUF2237 family protein n=1 Tax=Rhodobacter lacus TaxID=1641972 RepID=A0ABW5A889_9RHOB